MACSMLSARSPRMRLAIGVREIVLRVGPLLREGVAGPHGEGGLIGLDGLVRKSGVHGTGAVVRGGRVIDISVGPLLRGGVAGPHGEGGLIGLDGLVGV